jgi:hypothetical protein
LGRIYKRGSVRVTEFTKEGVFRKKYGAYIATPILIDHSPGHSHTHGRLMHSSSANRQALEQST